MAKFEKNACAIAHAFAQFWQFLVIFAQSSECSEAFRKPSWKYNECFCKTFLALKETRAMTLRALAAIRPFWCYDQHDHGTSKLLFFKSCIRQMYCKIVRYSLGRFPESFQTFWDSAKNCQIREKCVCYSPCILLNFGQFCSFLAKAQNVLKLSGNLPGSITNVCAIQL